MPQKLEYDFSVRRLNRATGADLALTLFVLGFIALMLSTPATAQVNGMPASVTSPGFGGRQVNGVAPSVTSLGPRGYTPASPTCCFRGVTAAPNQPHNPHPHRRNGTLPWGGVYGVPYYGYYDSGNDVADNAPDDQYNGGPTVFDRRGPGTAPAPAPAPYSSRATSSQPDSGAQSEADPSSDQPQTILVFKDGHQLEVANYAIVGSTLYDLTGGHHQKIALADLDLTATAKQNDDRGIDFQVPSPAEAN
ncbi:MAG TPA: hypothetical protein VN777_11440 [Terriglobales bacterium]|nr:hypothetical protein [Terriglobales bacterium]